MYAYIYDTQVLVVNVYYVCVFKICIYGYIEM